MRQSTLLAAALLVTACASSPGGRPDVPFKGITSEAAVVDADGTQIGTLRLSEGPRGVLLRIELRAGSLPPGWHGAHLHQRADCGDFATGFTASGAHVGHVADQPPPHGLLRGPEPGDLPNIYAPASGPIAAELFSPFVTLGSRAVAGRAPLGAGAALIIHANADDHTTQPIGGAGARIACAAIRPG